MAVPWSELLHDDILLQVFQWIPVPDLLRSAAVSTSWCSISGELRRLSLLHRRRVPWLLLYGADHRPAAAGVGAATFYSLLENKYYTIPLADPSMVDRKCVGSSHGWLITADDRSELQLFNPVTGAKITSLPSVSFSDDMAPGERHHKAVLSSNPAAGDYTIVLIHGSRRKLSYARAGDEKWTAIPSDCVNHSILVDDEKLYAMCCCGDVQVLSLVAGGTSKFIKSPAGRRQIGNGHYRYLVRHPSGGDPFLVWREPAGDDGGRFRFRVYRIDRRRRDGMMIEVDSLGDYALLVGINESLCLSSKEFSEMKANCIYFADEEQKLSIGAIGIYDLGDGSFRPPCELDERLWKRATWFTASLT